MSNKNQLQTNNAALDDYITRINAAKETAASLPNAGSGGIEDSLITRRLDGRYTNDRIDTIGNYAFASCTGLGTVAFPKCTNIGNSAFAGCASLVSATFGECKVAETAFGDCENLLTFIMTSAYYGASASIAARAFEGCYNLQRVILYPGYVVKLEDANAFENNIEIWVNGSVMSDYESDSIWGAYLSTHLRAIPTYTNDEGEIVCEEIE